MHSAGDMEGRGLCLWLLVSFGGNGGEGKGDLSCFAYSEVRGRVGWPCGSGLDPHRESAE